MAHTDPPRDAHQRFDEEKLRNDFRQYHGLTGRRLWAIVTDSEEHQLTNEIDTIASRWHNAPSPWKDHWDHLNAAARDWEHHPESTQRRLDSIASDYARTGATDLASAIQIRNLLLAGDLIESRRSDLGIAYSPGSHDHIGHTYRYLTSFRTAGDGTTTWQSLPSWSAARRWLQDQAEDTAAHTRVDITITGPDPLSGAAARPLMTGTDLTARELGEHLRQLDELLGTGTIPVDPSAYSWLDDLRYEVLCEAYRDTVLEHANPWAVGRRFEHYLRADDLYTDIVDYADRIGVHSAHERLAVTREDARRQDQWRTPPRSTTWLDDVVNDAHLRLDELTSSGIYLTYTDPARTNGMSVVGFAGNAWYVQHAQTAEDTRTIVYDTAPESYPSCDELLTALGESATHPISTPPVPDAITGRLCAFDRNLTTLRQELATARQLREAIRRGSPYTIRSGQQPGNRTQDRSPHRSAVSRDANRITLTSTPDSEQPTPPTESNTKPRAKRRQQPPNSVGRPHRRHL